MYFEVNLGQKCKELGMNGISFGKGKENLVVNFVKQGGGSNFGTACVVHDALSAAGRVKGFEFKAGAAKIQHPTKGKLTVDKVVFSTPANERNIGVIQGTLRRLGLAVETLTGKGRKNKPSGLLVRQK